MKTEPKPKLINDIQVFLGFFNFYQRFIKIFSEIAPLLISILQKCSRFITTIFKKPDNTLNNKIDKSCGLFVKKQGIKKVVNVWELESSKIKKTF